MTKFDNARYLGGGFDIYGKYSIDSYLIRLFDPKKAGTTTFTFQGTEYEIPNYLNGSENQVTDTDRGSFESREEVQNRISASAKVKGGCGAFSGEFDATYETEHESSGSYLYYFNFGHQTLGSITLDNPHSQYYTDEFSKAILGLPDKLEDKNLEKFNSFFEVFGSYYVKTIFVGGIFNWYMSIENSFTKDKKKIDVCAKAQYDGIFASGSFEGKFSSDEEKESFFSSQKIHAKGTGGDGAVLGKLANLDYTKASQATVQLIDQWWESIAKHPAVMKFELNGIWNLCEEKRETVYNAFLKFTQTMRPSIYVECTNENTTINVAGKTIDPPTEWISANPGFRLVVLDRKTLFDLDSEKPLINKTWSFDAQNFFNKYPVMYSRMYEDFVKYNLDSDKHIVVLFTWGMRAKSSPTLHAYDKMLEYGAGDELRKWTENSWISGIGTGINYILVGIPQLGVGSGFERYEQATPDPSHHREADSPTIRQKIYLYREKVGGNYSLGHA